MKKTIYLLTVLCFLAWLKPSFAQFNIIDKVKEKIEEDINKSDDESKKDEENKKDSEESETTTNKEGKPANKESLKTYSKFDFIPGDKVVYYDDFSQDAVGDFPALWNTNGSGEIQTTNLYPGNWFKITGSGWYIPDPFLELPDNFTIQFDLIMQEDAANNSNNFNVGFFIYEGNPKDPTEGGAIPGVAGIKIWFGQWGHSFSNYADGTGGISGQKDIAQLHFDEPAKISIWGQKQRIRIYVNEVKVFDVPKGLPADHKFNQLRFEPNQGFPLITNFRVAAGAPDMRNKLLTEGKLVTHGILFDVNSDKIKPESYGTLKEISKILQDNPAVRVKIVGHTDSDGSDDANLDLSKKRSISVKNSLKSEFGIDESRLETDGKGESEPISDNNTSADKANNRRVEFIKL